MRGATYRGSIEGKRDPFMRAVLTGLICALFVTTATTAAVERSPRAQTLVVRGAVRELAADGSRAAMLLGPRTACRLLVWNVGSGAKTPIRTDCSGSVRQRTFGVAVAGERVAWVETAGGNLLEMILKTATTANRKARFVSFVGSDPDVEGDYVGEVVAKTQRLFFTEYTRCAEAEEGEAPGGPLACPAGRRTGDVIRTGVWLFDPAHRGSRCPGETTFNRCRLLATSNDRMRLLATDGVLFVLRLADGAIELRTTGGKVLQKVAGGAGLAEAALSTRRFLVHQGSTLQIYDSQSGAPAGVLAVPDGSKLVDTAAGLAVLLAGRSVFVLRLADGKVARLRVPGTGAVHAQLESSGLYHSATGRVTFIPLKQLLRRFT